jgi:hypothetical protein
MPKSRCQVAEALSNLGYSERVASRVAGVSRSCFYEHEYHVPSDRYRLPAQIQWPILWLTDITEHPTTAGFQAREGKVYCCVVLDAFSRRVVRTTRPVKQDGSKPSGRTQPLSTGAS